MTIALVQSRQFFTGFDTGNLSFLSTPTAGNLILAAIASRGNAVSNITGGMTQVQQVNPVYRSDAISLWKLVSGGGNTFRFNNGSSAAVNTLLMEFSGVDQEAASGSLGGIAATATPSIPGATPNVAKTTSLLIDLLGWDMDEFSGTPTLGNTGGWTQLAWAGVDGSTAHPWSGVVYQIVTPPAGAVACAFTNSNAWSRTYGYIQAAFDLAADTGPSATARSSAPAIIG